MTYLVDANVLSEPTKLVPSTKVIDWLTANEGNFVVDSIILGELGGRHSHPAVEFCQLLKRGELF